MHFHNQIDPYITCQFKEYFKIINFLEFSCDEQKNRRKSLSIIWAYYIDIGVIEYDFFIFCIMLILPWDLWHNPSKYESIGRITRYTTIIVQMVCLGQNLPNKELYFLRSIIATTVIHWGYSCNRSSTSLTI